MFPQSRILKMEEEEDQERKLRRPRDDLHGERDAEPESLLERYSKTKTEARPLGSAKKALSGWFQGRGQEEARLPWAEHAWEARKCRQRVRTVCLIHLAGKRRKAAKVRARGLRRKEPSD